MILVSFLETPPCPCMCVRWCLTQAVKCAGGGEGNIVLYNLLRVCKPQVC